jgi:hypothetical protein
MNTQENRTVIQFARAIAVFLVLVVMGYAVSTQVESAIDAKPDTGASIAQQDVSATLYLPAQYVNQGKGGEEHIQGF